jgi:hypothetical protein
MPDQCFLARRSLSRLFRLEPEPRSGLSLACNGCAFRRPHSRVTGPRLLLRLLASSLLRPFGFPLRHRLRFAPSPAASSLRPVAAPRPDPADCASCLHSPPGFLNPSGSKRSTGFAARQLAFRTRPISARSPQPASIARFGCGSSSAIRYVSGGWLFLKPLGTSTNMRYTPLLGQWFFDR